MSLSTHTRAARLFLLFPSRRIASLLPNSSSPRLTPLFLRTYASIPTHFVPGGPEPPNLLPPPAPKRSASSEFYRALVPSMLHCLALGSIVYYALELGWMWLKREKEGEELTRKVAELERELALERTRGISKGKSTAEDGKGGSWWKIW